MVRKHFFVRSEITFTLVGVISVIIAILVSFQQSNVQTISSFLSSSVVLFSSSWLAGQYAFWIEGFEDYIIIRYNNFSFKFDKGYALTSNNKKLTISDDYMNLEIPYNHKIAKFLKEINN